MKPILSRPLLALLLIASGAAAVVAGAATTPPPPNRDAFASDWSAHGLVRVHAGRTDLFYARPGQPGGTGPMQLAPVVVEMHRDWLRANNELERIRLRPEEEQQLKDEVARIVADELQQELAVAPAGADASGPVLEVRVLDLFINAPEMRAAVRTQSYTRSYGDMVLVAELRDHPGGELLAASWERPPPREFVTLRLTTRVENAIEVRKVAQAWARKLGQDLGRSGARH